MKSKSRSYCYRSILLSFLMICDLPFHRPEETRFIIGPKSSRLSLEVTKRVGPSNEAAVNTEPRLSSPSQKYLTVPLACWSNVAR